MLDLLDARGHGYLIKVKMRNLAQLLGQQRWTPIHRRRGWEQCEFSHRAGGWSRERFFLAVRCPQARDADHPQGELRELECYDCFCYVSTEPLSPWLAHRTYGQRATSETWIEEAKSQMGLAHLKTVHFLANAALFQCAVLAYNTLRWMTLLSGNAQLKRRRSDRRPDRPGRRALFGAASALALPAPIRPAKATAGGGCGGDSVIRPAIVAPAIAH